MSRSYQILVGLALAAYSSSTRAEQETADHTRRLVLDSPLIEAYDYLPLLEAGSAAARLSDEIMKAVRVTKPGKKRRLLATLKVRMDYRLHMDRELESADIEQFRRSLENIHRGEDPFTTGWPPLRGYYAANDDSCQPFKVALPCGYRAGTDRHYPLIVLLHHHGWSDWYRPFQGYPYSVDDAIVIAPHGRGSCDYLWIAEDDVLSCIDAAEADFQVDPARIYVTGWSMGGTGSFHLPGRYPHRFAASFPKAGNADFTAWEEAWKEDRQRMASPHLEKRMFLRWETAPVTYAENFLHVPISIDHGEWDTINPVGHSRSMDGRLRQLGYNNVDFRAGEGGHGWGASLDERYGWMKKFKIDPNPKRVRFKTGNYRHGTAYWLAIDRISRRMALAEIDIKVESRSRIEISRIENVDRFTIKLDRLNLKRNRQLEIAFEGVDRKVTIGELIPATVSLSKKVDGAWSRHFPESETGEEKWPPSKRLGLEGPIEDAVRDPFLVVIGTEAEDPFERWIVKCEAERWLRQWRRRFQAVPAVKLDKEITQSDIETKNLILFGGPTQNAVTNRINSRLPVRFEGSEIVAGDKRYRGNGLGLKLIYPNPENPARTAVVFGAADWRGMWQVSHRFGTWFDWMPLDNRQWFDFCVFDEKTRGFETFLDVGFFDEDWSLKKAVRFFALENWRERTPPRNLPVHRKPPAGEIQVRLIDLWPAQIDTAREPLRISRSLNGKPLSIGEQRQAFGFGQWIESAVTYEIGGKFRRFKTRFGIDAEGQKNISEARRDVEFTDFIVLADGRPLARERSVRFGDPPGQFNLDVTGVQRLTLMVLRTTAQGWLYGPICWGEPVLIR